MKTALSPFWPVRLATAVCLALAAVAVAQRTTENVSVGRYIYADLEKVDDASGGLVVRFADESPTRKVIAYGWANRKLRRSRADTVETQRENFKPRLAVMSQNGKVATFAKLPPDFYDVAVVDYVRLTFHEGMTLHHLAADDNQPAAEERPRLESSIATVIMGSREDGIQAWEVFFDRKQLLRTAFADEQAGVLLQQMRTGTAFAESGTKLAGSVHSLDIVWLERTRGDGKDAWQVIQRQQLYRGELERPEFFRHVHLKELSGIRVGRKVRTLKTVLKLD